MGGVSSLFAQTVQVGTIGTTKSNIYPYISTYAYSTSQQIYKAAEINQAGTISKIAFHLSDEGVNKKVYDVKIYMKHTTKNDFPGKTDWDKTVTSDHLVYDGNPDITNSLLEIPLTTPFEYDGKQNLLVCFDVNSKQGDATYYRTYKADSKRVMYYRNANNYGPDATNYYNNAASSSPTNMIPVITLTFGGSVQAKDPEFTDMYAYPNGQYATNIFNPYLKFYAENKTHYKVLLSTTSDFSSDVRYVAGSATTWAEAATSVKEITTSTVEGLNYSQATTYYWKVIASNGGGADDPTAESTVYSFTTKQISAPGQIENAYPNGHQDLVNPEFTWTFGSDTEEYQVIIDGEAKTEWTNPGSSTTGSYQTSGLSAGEHTWRIDAKNSVATTTGTEYSFSVASLPDNVTPISPADGATGVTSNIVKFQFAKGTTEYRLLYSDTNKDQMSYIYDGGTGNTWTSTGGATEMEFTIPGFGLGKKLYWAVDVKNAIGQRSVWNGGEEIAIYSFTAASTLPVTYAYPKNNAVASEVNPALSWNYQGSAAWYQVLFGTSEDNLAVFKDWTARGSNDSFQTTGLNAASQYYWQVNVKETENSEVLYGEIVSFITKLEVPQNVNANPTEVEPSLGEYGATQIMWNKINGANSYNVYLDGKMLANTARNSFNVEANTLKIKSNIDPGYNFTVTAVYEEYGESQASEAVNVKVANIGTPIVYVKDADNKPIEGVTIELTGINEFGKEKTYTITTDKDGKGSKSVLVADYAMTVSKEPYSTKFIESVKIEKNSEKIVNVTLTSEYYYSVTAKETEANGNIKLTLTGKDAGSYDIYIKTNGVESLLVKDAWFDGFGLAQYEYTSWNTLNNGTYQFGVANSNSNIINWSNEITRSYAIFETEGNWNTASNWRDGLPKENDDVLIYANATIAATDNITVADVNIIEGSLTINGSLTADKVYNETNNAEAVCVNDGGQLFQNNTELSGKFVMNIRNDWSASNKGWQFIASPFVDATTASFESTEGDFDLYKYNGSADKQWVNYKKESEEPEQPSEPEQPGDDDTKSSFAFDFNDGTLNGWRTYQAEDATGNGWQVTSTGDTYYSGEDNSKGIYSDSYNETAYNYVVTTEAYEIASTSELSWYMRPTEPFYSENDVYQVIASEDGETFDIILGTYRGNGNNYNTLPLASYAGEALYIGFYHYSDGLNCAAIVLDNITLTTGSKTRSSNTRSFDSQFAQGVGYLASYETQATATLVGTFNTKTSFEYEVSYTEGNELANFHLLGNPFTFNMDWSKVAANDMVNGYAVVNEDGNYEYSTEGEILVGDGFFVKAIDTDASLSYTHNARSSQEKANSINVIASGKAGKDNVIVNFAGQAEGFDKLQNFNDAIATVYVSENGKNYGIANVDENTTEVALNFDAKEMGNYTISLDVNGEFETVTLVDRFTGVETNMLVEDEYSFIASNDDNVNRFVIRLAQGSQLEAQSQFVYQSGEELILSIEGSVQIVDMLGRVVYSNEHANGDNRINVSEFNNATYVVRVINEEGVKVQKVVIY